MQWILAYLAGVTARSLCLFVLALAAVAILRVRTAAARHAIWTVVMAGMLLLTALAPLAPPVALRVLGSASLESIDLTAPAAPLVDSRSSTHSKPSAPTWQWPTWDQVAVAVYLLVALILLARLAFGYLFTRRLVKGSSRTELGPDEICESTWISVPFTVGWLRPKILLPAGWRQWEPGKLAAVLAHERTHVRRADWGIALLAGVNRCLFWFHPLAWWLEGRLAALAEQACDDSALLEVGSREPYAQALLDMAAAVKSGQGRMVWEAMAMAKASEVTMRIERILDETRQIPSGVMRRRWAMLAACSLPLIYAAAVVQLAPARAQGQQKVETGAAVTGAPEISKLTSADASRMEQQLVTNPDDLQTRSKLIAYYFLNGIREPRLTHILWLIEHHPESEITAFNSGGISPEANSLNTIGDYERASTLWRQQVAVHPQDAHVLANAAQFYAQRGGDWYEAERLLNQAGDTSKLAALYSKALQVSTDASGMVHFPALNENLSFATHVVAELDNSTDGQLLFDAGNQLRSMPVRGDPQTQRLLQPRVEFGQRLVARAGQYGVSVPEFMARRATAIARANPSPAPRAESQYPPPPAPASIRPLTASSPQTSGPEPKPPTPARIRVGGNVQMAMLVQKVEPTYPEQARTAGPDGGPLEGTVTLSIVIGNDGLVKSMQPTAGHPLLATAAEDAVQQWAYEPTLLNGNPVEVSTTVDVPFTAK